MHTRPLSRVARGKILQQQTATAPPTRPHTSSANFLRAFAAN